MPRSLRSYVRCVRWMRLLVATGFLQLPSAVFADTPLTLAEALRVAEARAPAVAASASAAQAARERAVAAGELPDPVLRAGLDNVPISGPDALSLTRDSMTMARIGVMQEYVSRAKRDARREREERDARRYELEGTMSLAEVRTEVATTWLDRLYAGRSEQLLRGLVDELASQARTIEALVGSGKAFAGDVLAARALQVQSQDRVLEAQRQQQAATARLARWLGEDANRPSSGDAPPTQDTELALLERRDVGDIPQLRALASEVALAEADVTVARENRSPNWSFEVAYQQRGPGYDNMISVGVSVPLPIDRASRQDRELAARLSQRDQARELLQDATRRRRAEFESMRVEWLALRERERALRTSLIPLARQRVDAQLAAYRGGQQGLAPVLDARRALVDAELAILDLERDAARVLAQLTYTYLDGSADANLNRGGKP